MFLLVPLHLICDQAYKGSKSSEGISHPMIADFVTTFVNGIYSFQFCWKIQCIETVSQYV